MQTAFLPAQRELVHETVQLFCAVSGRAFLLEFDRAGKGHLYLCHSFPFRRAPVFIQFFLGFKSLMRSAFDLFKRLPRRFRDPPQQFQTVARVFNASEEPPWTAGGDDHILWLRQGLLFAVCLIQTS